MAETSKQPGYKDNVDAPPPTDDERVVAPRDLVSTGNIPDNPKELLSNPGFAPQMINEGDNLRSDLREDE
ncbi:MAG: hypothetical protein U7127_01225 [Phormidium sp.]